MAIPPMRMTARAFGIDAARDGEPTAFTSMVRMPWGRFPRDELLAWQYFGDRLNEAGCMGDQYVPTSLAFGQTIGLLERNAESETLEAAAARSGSALERARRARDERKRLRIERLSRTCAISCSSPLSSGLVPEG